jgi:hypothetical protein
MTQWGLDVLFNPAKRHMDEEKQRLQSTREEVGDSSDGKRIDLTTGRVVIRRKASDATDATENADDETADDANDDDETAENAAGDADEVATDEAEDDSAPSS